MRTSWILLAIAGCRAREAPPPPPVPGWAPLIDAVVRGDAPAAAGYTAGLVHVDRADDGGAREAIGGGAGFLRFAEDPEELAEALVGIATGCGACHRASAVAPPSPPGTAHPDLAARLLDPLVWSRPPAGPDTDPHLPDAILALPDPRRRATAGFSACAGCHGGGR